MSRPEKTLESFTFAGLSILTQCFKQTGVLVSKDDVGGGGWFVKWADLGGGLQFFSTGGFGHQFHLEYLDEGGRKRETVGDSGGPPVSGVAMGQYVIRNNF